MSSTHVPVTKRTLFDWVRRSNLKLQILLVFIIIVTVGARILPLEMQKKIINEAINLRRIDLLYLYCGLFLAAVVASSALKFAINALQAYIGQQALSDIRKDLYHHILTLPVSYFRKTPSGMVVSSLVTEVASAGDFVGMAIAVPLTSVLTLLAFAGYLFWLNWQLALISMVIYPVVLLVVPRLQRRTNMANKERVDNTRTMSGKIGEAVTGIHEIHGNGSYEIENRKYDSIIDEQFRIRVKWNLYKYGTKVANNFFINLGPFFIFIVGGYLAINGRFDLGALVAFLSAQEKLYEPWSELLDFYQVGQDASIRYYRSMEYFDAEPEHELESPDRRPYDLEPRVEIENLSFVVEGGIRLLSDVNLTLKPGEQLALVGFSGSGKSTLAMCVAQLYRYTSGSVRIGGREVSEMTKRDVVHNVGYVAQSPFIFDGTIRENLLYSWAALRLQDDKDQAVEEPSLDDMIEVLQQTGLFADVLQFGLNAVLGLDEREQFQERIIRVRQSFSDSFGEDLSEYVEFFEENTYLYHSTVAANLVFGNPNLERFALDDLYRERYFLDFLNEAHLTKPLIGIGAELARQTVDILGNMPPDAVLFRESPVPPEEIEEYKELVERLKRQRLSEMADGDQARFLRLGLGFIPGRHKVVALPEMLESLILESRYMFRKRIEGDHPNSFTFYKRSEYIHSQSVLDNILFGKPKTESQKARETISRNIIQLLIEEDLLESVVEIGMNYEVGTKGDKLSGGQRQKLAIGRVLIKRPNILVLDEATSALDNRSQTRIQNLLETRWKGRSTVIAVVHRLDTIKNYDKVAVMKAGKIIELGTYDELLEREGGLYELVRGRKSQ